MVNGVDFIPERDMELYEAYRRALKMREVKSHREAVMRAISSHASRFWISTLQAYRGILLIRKGKTKEKGRSINGPLFLHILFTGVGDNTTHQPGKEKWKVS